MALQPRATPPGKQGPLVVCTPRTLTTVVQKKKSRSLCSEGRLLPGGHILPLVYLLFVLDGLLSFVTLLCRLECTVYSAAREYLGLCKCGWYKQLYYFKRFPALLRFGGWCTLKKRQMTMKYDLKVAAQPIELPQKSRRKQPWDTDHHLKNKNQKVSSPLMA